MASKYQTMSALFQQTANEVTSNPVRWISFLNTASSVYKYPFSDQLMIYSQRPNATACASLELWNKKMHRWVNRGAKGIALLDDSRTWPKLRYVFDIQDTHLGINGRTPFLWHMEERHHEPILQHLIETYNLDETSYLLRDALMEVARNSVMDNLEDYFTDFKTSISGSFLEELDDLNLQVRFRDTLISSVQYMLLYRCGFDPKDTFDLEDFSFITDFNTLATVSQIGYAVNDVAKPILMDIGREIRACEIEIQKARWQEITYNNRNSTEPEKSTIEGGNEHETELHPDRGLPDSESNTRRTADNSAGQIRDASQNLPETASGRDISGVTDERQIEPASDGNRSGSEPSDRATDETISEGETGSRQEPGSDGLDSAQERAATDSRGDRAERPDISLTDTEERTEPEAEGVEPPASFLLPVFPSAGEQIAELGIYEEPTMLSENVPGEVLDELLRSGGNKKHGQLRIAVLYMEDLTNNQRIELLSTEYGNGSMGIKLHEEDFSLHFDQHGIQIAPGHSIQDAINDKVFVSWADADHRIQTLLSSGSFLPQVALDNVLDNERTELATSLLYLYHDFNYEEHEFTYFDRKELSGGYPEATARWADKLADPNLLHKEIEILSRFQKDLEADRSLLRFHYHKIPQLLERLQRLSTADQLYRANENFVLPKLSKFITDDQINSYLCNHGGRESRLRTYSFFLRHPAEKERSDFLKETYGIGGQTPASFSEYSSVDYDAKGLKLTLSSPDSPVNTVLLKWSKVEKLIEKLIHENQFLSVDDRTYFRSFERDHLAMDILTFTEALPYAGKNPVFQFDFDREKAKPALYALVDDPNKLMNFISLMEQSFAELPKDYRSYALCQRTLTELQAYRDGTFTLFPESSLAHNQNPVTVERQHSKEQTDGQLSLSDFFSGMEKLEPAVSFTKQSESTQEESLAIFTLTSQNEYNALKEQYPNYLIGFEQNGSFEFYGEDAKLVADLLQTKLLDKELATGGTVSVTGFSQDSWAAPSKKLWSMGHNVYLAAENSNHTHYEYKELQAKEYVPIGTKLTIDNRQFQVESVDFTLQKASLIDLTFLQAIGFPINRSEPLDYVREFIEEQLPSEHRLVEEKTAISTSSASLERESDNQPEAELPKQEPAETTAKEPFIHPAINFHITDDDLGAGGSKTKFKANIAAIRLLQDLELDGRMATAEEQEILSRYVGWGGLPMAFDASNKDWKAEYEELKSLLSPEEYTAARGSTLNAHYTSPAVIHAMYDVLSNLGFSSGNILEPSCGIGNFFGCLPQSMQESKLYGVELDSITGRIAKQLYQKADITIEGFEKTQFPDDFFDVVVGNVPFGNYQVADRRYDRNHFQIHDYFVAKSLDQVRPGGIVAVITSSGTMDKQSTQTREYLAQRADLLGAIRLPNNAFRRNANTDVVADILFFQKRDHAPVMTPEWVNLSKTDDGHTINQYFVSHPEMILGQLTTENTQYGKQEVTVIPIPNADLEEQLHEAISHIHGTITAYELSDSDLDEETVSVPADPNVQNFSFTVLDGDVYYRENSRMNKLDLPAATSARVCGMVELRDTTRKLLNLELADASDSEIQTQMMLLNRQYDQFTKKYGLLNSTGNRRAFNQDASYSLLASLEILNEEGNLDHKADIFTKRTIRKPEPVTSVDTAVEALTVPMGEKAHVDLDYMSELYGKSREQICEELRGLIFQEPISGQWQTADEYLSGNVRKKLEVAQTFAETHPEFQINVEHLKQVQPPDISAADISARLGVNWIDAEIINQFMAELLQTPGRFLRNDNIKVLYSPVTDQWRIKGKTLDSNNPVANVTYGTERASAYRLLEDALNQRTTKIYDTVPGENGEDRRVENPEQTILAQQKQDSIKEAFQSWIFRDPERREQLTKRYNELFNSIRPREYDGSFLTFPGMNPEVHLRPHQKNGAAHVIYGNNTLLAHCVGSGKTYTCIASAMESKRLGLCQKSLFVVPNHLTAQWGADILTLYPNAKILVATKKDFEPANRRKFCSRIATGDYDAVVIGHTQFEKIPLSPERQTSLIQQQIDDVVAGISAAKEENQERFTIKQMEATRKRLEVKLEKLTQSKSKDDVVTFEQLGVDRLYVDESQEFKNLYCFTKMSNVAGVATTDAQKSSDLYMKCQYMDELTGGRGITFATGTPISNSMTELFTLMRYLQADTLRDMGLQHFDAWAAQFGETVTAIELAPEGTGYRAKTRFARFYNLPELMSVWKECADIQTSDMLNLPTPKVQYEDIVLKPSEEQAAMVSSLGDRAEIIRSGGIDPSIDNMLKVTNDGRKLALDQRLINPLLPDQPESKVNACVDQVYQIWEKTKPKKLTQIIFCDLSTPKGDGSFNVYDDIRDKLTAKGIPREEVAFIHEATTDVQKANLFSKVRSGQVRVILGSTSKMGAGTNIQDLLYAMHHLDVPWRPSDVEQQEGRILRQGNNNPSVRILRYLTESTFDAYMWQILENKQKFISQLMTSKSPARSCEDVDDATLKFAEVKALASGNPLIMEKVELDTQVTKLKLMKSNHISQHYQLEDALIKTYPKQIAECTALIDGLTADLKQARTQLPQDTDHFSMTIAGKVYTERKEAGTAIIAACAGLKAVDKGGAIGSYAGFSLHVQFDSFSQQYRLNIKGKTTHSIEVGTDPSGNITRINNVLNGLEGALNKANDRLSDLHAKVTSAKEELARPFPQEEELAEKQARLNEVNATLNMDKSNPSKHSDPQQSKPESEIPIETTVIAIKPVTPRKQSVAYADQSHKTSLLTRLHEKQGQLSRHSDSPTRSHHDKSQSL